MMKNVLAAKLADDCRRELDAQEVRWDDARLMVEYVDETSDEGGVLTCMYMSQGSLGGILLDSSIWGVLNQMRAALTQESGETVMRFRVDLGQQNVDSKVDFFHDRVEGSLDWFWPDEPEYGGRVYSPRVVERVDSWKYPQIAGSIGEVSDSLARIGAWLDVNEPEYAAMLNPPASVAALDQLEQDLGVVLPRSVREAWLVHDGQSGRGVLHYTWLPVGESADQLQYFSSRPDRGEGFIPIMTFDGIVLFVEPVDEPGQDGPVWLWETNTDRDERLADSFGEYLAWFADESEAGNITGELLNSVLVHRGHV